MVEFVIKTKLASASKDFMGTLARKGKTHHIFSVKQEFGKCSKYFDSHHLKTVQTSLLRQHLNKGILELKEHLVSW